MDERTSISMMRYIYCAAAVSLLVCGITFLFFSCETDDISGGKQNQEPVRDGKMMAVQFALDDSNFGENEVFIRQRTTPGPSGGGEFLSPFGGVGEGFQPVIVPLADDLYMHVTLEETPVELRAKVPLALNTQVGMLAYVWEEDFDDNDNTLGYFWFNAGYAEYRVASNTSTLSTLAPVDNPLMVVEDSYRFVAYSLNSPDSVIRDLDDFTYPLSDVDMMWGTTGSPLINITPTNTTVHVSMVHKFAKVQLVAETATHATTWPGAGLISAISAGIYTHKPVMRMEDGKFFFSEDTVVAFPASPVDLIHFKWPSTGGTTSLASNPSYVYTLSNTTRLNINSVTIDGNTYTNSSNNNEGYPVIFNNLTLQPGKSYTFRIRLKSAPATLFVKPASLYFSHNTTTPQTVEVSTNQPSWSTSVVYNQDINWLTINPPSGSGATTTFTVVPGNNTTDVMRTATITVSAGGLNKTINVVQYGDVGGGAAILYYDDATQTLQVGRWGYELTDIRKVTLFRFGGVIGLDNHTNVPLVGNNYTFSGNVIKFNPSSLSSFPATGGNLGPSVGAPNYYSSHGLGNAWNTTIASSPKVSDDAYHTLANVKAGKGDPCRLVGMTVAQIQGFANDAQLYAAEQGWRTPAIDENVKYVKGPGPWITYTIPTGYTGNLTYPTYTQSNTSPWSNTEANFYVANSQTVANPAVFWTPVVQAANPNFAGECHPTPGWRHQSGPYNPTQVGIVGDFWSNTPYSGSAEAYVTAVTGGPSTGSLHAASAHNAAFYISVRCVRKD